MHFLLVTALPLTCYMPAQMATWGFDNIFLSAIDDEEHYFKTVQNERAEALRKLSRGLPSKGIVRTIYCAFGSPRDIIPRVADQYKADVIVVGRRPMGDVKKWWLSGAGSGALFFSDFSKIVTRGRRSLARE